MLIAVLLSGCKKESSKSKIVELSDASSNVILVKDLMSNCQWIQLDSIQEALIGDATRIIEYDEKYYILDIASRKKVLVFDETGKFLNSIGNLGSGEGEYVNVLDFAVNTDTGEVIILSDASTVFIYNSDGSFIKNKKLTESLLWHITFADGQYICSTDHCTYLEGGNAYLLYVFDENLNEEGKFLPVLSRQMPSTMMFEGILTSLGGESFYMDMFNRSLYKIKKGIEPIQLYEFSLPDPMDISIFAGGMDFYMQQTQHDWIKSFIPLKNSYLFTYVVGGKLCMAEIMQDGSLQNNGLVGGILPKMFPGSNDCILSPVSRLEYEMEWQGKSEEEISNETIHSNLMLLKWNLSTKQNQQ